MGIQELTDRALLREHAVGHAMCHLGTCGTCEEVIARSKQPLSRFEEIVDGELLPLQRKKQQDYGSDEDPLANIRGSERWGIKAWLGAMIRCTDKIRRLETFARKGTLANESVIDAFNDLAVYAILARILYEESIKGDA